MYGILYKLIKNIMKLTVVSFCISILKDIKFYITYSISFDKINNENKQLRESKSYKVELNEAEKVENIVRSNEVGYDLSIIIPAYNSQHCIGACIKSILNQETNFNYEIIIVNDGSIDDTQNEIEKFSIHKNITIISQKNKGISASRNKGLELARGSYVMFVDSDDLLSDDAIESLLKKAFEKDIDIVQGNNNYVYKGKDKVLEKPLSKNTIEINLKENPEFILKIKGFPWGRVYSRKLWEDVEFPVGFDYEDTIIQFIIFRKAKSYCYINQVVYEYTVGYGSISTKLQGSNKSLDTFYIISYLINISEQLNIPFDETFYRIILNQLGSLLYIRTRGVDQTIIRGVIGEAAGLLRKIEVHSPKLKFKDRCLKEAILDENIKKWIACCKNR
jgi:glycosyltransferase involved in cell wall biosynthesis